MKKNLTFVKFGCGCIGFKVGDDAIIVKACNGDSRGDVRWDTEADVHFAFKSGEELVEEQSRRQKAELEYLPIELSAEDNELWMDRIRKQLWAGSRLRDVQSLLGIEVK